MSQTLPFVIAMALIIPGIGFALIPMLPALLYMLIVSVAYAMYDKFTTLTGRELLMLSGIVIVSIIVDHTAGALGAKYGGARTKSLFWGILGAILGTLFIPILGGFVGLFLGVLIAEIHYKRNTEKAIKAAGSAVLGSFAGVAVNFILAFVFAILFFFFAKP